MHFPTAHRRIETRNHYDGGFIFGFYFVCVWISLSLSPISVRFGADFCMAEMAFANFQLHLFARKALDVDGFPILLSVFFLKYLNAKGLTFVTQTCFVGF